MNTAQYHAFTNNLQKSLEADNQVIALVALGSMAGISRQPDDYSDHDFFVITQAGVQEDYRQDLSWLPEADNIVLQVRETAHGLKVLYKNGHLLEFAIFDAEELNMARVNDYRVLFDKATITDQLSQIQTETTQDSAKVDVERAFSLFLSLLIVGSGRAARGETLSAHVFIKTYALSNLLTVLAAVLPSDTRQVLDNLDPFRRIEQAYPTLAPQIHAALLQAPIVCGQHLLDIAETQLQGTMRDYPAEAVIVVRDYLQNLR